MKNYSSVRIIENENAFTHVGSKVTMYNNENGFYHRLDGPAMEWENGMTWYYINGKELSQDEYNNHPDVLKYKMIQEAKQLLGIEK